MENQTQVEDKWKTLSLMKEDLVHLDSEKKHQRERAGLLIGFQTIALVEIATGWSSLTQGLSLIEEFLLQGSLVVLLLSALLAMLIELPRSSAQVFYTKFLKDNMLSIVNLSDSKEWNSILDSYKDAFAEKRSDLNSYASKLTLSYVLNFTCIGIWIVLLLRRSL
jgi:hypothetical protein